MQVGDLVRCIGLFPPVRGEGIGIIAEVKFARYWNSEQRPAKESTFYTVIFTNGQLSCVKEDEIEVINEI